MSLLSPGRITLACIKLWVVLCMYCLCVVCVCVCVSMYVFVRVCVCVMCVSVRMCVYFVTGRIGTGSEDPISRLHHLDNSSGNCIQNNDSSF